MRILITGGAGFIGSHLTERLLMEGHEVVCLDSLLTGSESSIAHLKNNPLFTFIQHDIVEPFFYEPKIDQIYNLACPASPVHYQNNPVHTTKACTIGVINMLGFARKHGARFLQASTSEVYGDPEVHPQNESYRGNVNTIGPRACYDEGKRCAETLCLDYYRMHGLEIKIIRIFNTYGPRMAFNDGRVISNFLYQALRGERLTIDGDGSQTRSFCYVDDLVEGMIRLMNTPSEFQGPVNVGNPVEFTIKELAEKVVNLVRHPSGNGYIFSEKFREDDPMQRCPDISLAQKVLGWSPTINLETGLIKTLADFRGRLSSNN
jgi:UDP-glucuronate decarboxylase